MRFALCVVAVAACGGDSGSTASCELEDIVADLTPDGPTDCGTFDLTVPDSELMDAMGCMTDAIGAQQPFFVIWDQQGIDSQVRAAYVGTNGASGYTVSRIFFDSDPSGGSMVGESASEALCVNIQVDLACADVREALCFSCTGGNSETVCRNGSRF